jgi:TolB-like protein/predicted Ser/Thr protein kinase
MLVQADGVLAHYRLTEQIGEGGMGTVWKAYDTVLGRDVALKMLAESLTGDPDRLAAFEREAHILAALNHPNIVTIYSVEQAATVRFLTMELIDGKTLAQLIPPDGLPLERVLDVACAVADALDAAHSHGITHRDLTPANIIVTGEGRIKVVDFGLAKHAARASENDVSGPTGTFRDLARSGALGTLPYKSPEQFEGPRVDHRSDLFSFGVVLYEMAAGRRPFDGTSGAAVVRALLTEHPLLLTQVRADVPPPLARLAARCLEKSPLRRVQTAGEVLHVLRRLRKIAAATAPTTRLIAVLPFDDESALRDQSHLCEGVAEAIMMALGGVSGLRVASRALAFGLKASGLDSQAIAERLEADVLLVGRLRRDGDRLQMGVELVNALDGYELWSARYEREMKEVFAIQDEIAHHVAAALELTLNATGQRALRLQYPTAVAAYDDYLRGRQFRERYNRPSIEVARLFFAQALTLDPDYASAHVALADCHAYLYSNGGGDPAHVAAALKAGRKALDLAPDFAEAHAAMAVALCLGGCDAGAEREFEAAIRLNREMCEAHYCYAHASLGHGKAEQALRHCEEAVRIRPRDYRSRLLMAEICDSLGRPDEADAMRRCGVTLADEHLRVNADDTQALFLGANGLVSLRDRTHGLQWARRALALEPDNARFRALVRTLER